MANTLNLGDGNWGVKDSSLLGYAKDNTKFVPETFDVTRASGGTRVNKDGLIETPTEIGSELITNGDFSDGLNNWNSEQGIWTVSNGVANGNGASGSSQELRQDISPSGILAGDIVKLSFEIKNYVSGSVQVVGVTNTTSVSANGIYEYVGDVLSVSIRFRGSAFNGSVTNVSVKEYNDENLARIDYTDSVDGVLLTEPQSTNLITDSEDFSDISWSKTRSAISSNVVTSPNGEINADKFIGSSASGDKKNISSVSVVSGNKYTFSVFAKKDEFDGIVLRLNTAGFPSGHVLFSLDTGVGATTGVVDSFLSEDYGNGWWRLSVTNTADTSVNCPLELLLANNGAIITTGNDNDGIYIWGAQLEQLPHPTSYMPTYGAIASRAGDLVANAGDVNNFNSEQGVLYAEIAALSNATQDNRYITISNGSSTNRIILRYQGSGIGFYIIANGTGALSGFYAITDTTQTIKVALRWNTNDVAMFVDGTKRVQENTFTTYSPNTLDRLNMASVNGGTFPFYGKTKNIQVFNEALSDAELQTLTTI